MPRKREPSTPEHKAYGRGYTAGRNRERRTAATVIAALNRQVDYWRAQFERLRGRESNVDAEYHIVSINQGADGWEARYRDEVEHADEACDAIHKLLVKQFNADIAANPRLMKMLEKAKAADAVDPHVTDAGKPPTRD